jgi:hypothetical protein
VEQASFANRVAMKLKKFRHVVDASTIPRDAAHKNHPEPSVYLPLVKPP